MSDDCKSIEVTTSDTSKFQIVIMNKELEKLEMYCTTVTLPSYSFNVVEQNSQFNGKTIYKTGNKIKFLPISCEILENDNLDNYTAITNYVFSGIDPNTGKVNDKNLNFDISILKLNKKNNATKICKLFNAKISQVDSLILDSKNKDEPVVFGIEIVYDGFKIGDTI